MSCGFPYCGGVDCANCHESTEPAMWQCRSYSHEQKRWGKWGEVKGSDNYKLTQRLSDIRDKIAKGCKWELRALYERPGKGAAP